MPISAINPVSRLHAFALWLTLISVACFTPGAIGQGADQDEQELQEIEELVITGTRVRGIQGPVGSAVIGITREDVESSAEVDVTNLLREVPQILNLGVTDVTRDTSGGNGNISYGNAVNIRGLGPFSTLTLVNGHRVPINVRNFEPSSIAMLALDRIEVVPDGASAVYGSDAVAGVVNLVLRRDVDGGQLMVRSGSADGYSEMQAGISYGTSWDSGQVFLAYEESTRSNYSGDDTDFYGLGQETNQCSPGNIVIDGVSYAIPDGGVTAANAGTLTPNTENLCNPLKGQDIRPEQERSNFAMTFDQEITDNFSIYGDAYYSQRDTTRLTGWSNVALTVPDTNAFFVDPTGSATTSTVNYAMEEYPISGSQNEPLGARFHQVALGAVYEFGNDWQVEALYSTGESIEWSNSRTGIDNGALTAALASSDPATAYDPYGLGRTSQAVLDDIKDFIFLVDNQLDFTGNELIVSGPLFDIGGGTVEFAGGFERQEYDFVPLSARGGPTTPFGCRPCSVAGVSPPLERDVNSYYAELLIPFVGASNARSGVESFSVRAAIRSDDYSDVGDTTNPQFGFTWEPNADIAIRGSWGTSFRAPVMPDLFGNSSAMFVEQFPDPTLGGTNITGVFRSGGNTSLSPEEATTWTLGLDWEPQSVPGLEISLTYFDVEYENQIQQYLGDNNILFREELFEGTGIILRGAEANQRMLDEIASGTPVFGPQPNPLVLFVDGRPQNLGVTLMSGLDFQVRYGWNTDSGNYNLGLSGTYNTKYEEAQTPGAPLVDELNTIYNPKKFRARGQFGWSAGAFSAGVGFNYLNGYDNTLTVTPEDVDSHMTWDVNAAYRLGEGGTGIAEGWLLRLDITNLFDQDPPEVNVFPYGFDPTAHDPMARLVSVSLRKDF